MLEIIIIAFIDFSLTQPLVTYNNVTLNIDSIQTMNSEQRCIDIVEHYSPNHKIETNLQHKVIIEEQALLAGVKIGFYDASAGIYDVLNDELTQRQLDHQYNFQSLVYKGHMLLPVVSSNQNIQLFDYQDQKRRDIDLIITIERPALLISDLPNWRNYLYQMPFQEKIRLPEIAYHPNEYYVLKQSFCQGYRLGQEQAFREFQANLNFLVNEYTGMLFAYELVARNILTLPDFEVLELGNERSKEEGKERFILGQRLYKINRQPTFNPPKHWVLKDITVERTLSVSSLAIRGEVGN